MRHLASLLAALIVAPVSWVLLAYGQTGLQAGWDHRETFAAVRPWPEKVAFLAAAGLLLGLVATTRISPVGPLLAGLLYGGYGVAALWRKDVYDVLPATLDWQGRSADLTAPVRNGTAVVIGVLLLTAVVSVRRWQRWPKPAPGAPGADAAAGAADEPTGTGEALTADRTAALRADQPTERVVADGFVEPDLEWSRPEAVAAGGSHVADPAPATIPAAVMVPPPMSGRGTDGDDGPAGETVVIEPAEADGPATDVEPAGTTAADSTGAATGPREPGIGTARTQPATRQPEAPEAGTPEPEAPEPEAPEAGTRETQTHDAATPEPAIDASEAEAGGPRPGVPGPGGGQVAAEPGTSPVRDPGPVPLPRSPRDVPATEPAPQPPTASAEAGPQPPKAAQDGRSATSSPWSAPPGQSRR